ncbi:MAG: proprotein convertase P-domain-containing protein [Deltaproteobacteria bacterium]|nr:proprotein convertase P-domain-containing protein [Deltaproteobacteria bacterium]
MMSTCRAMAAAGLLCALLVSCNDSVGNVACPDACGPCQECYYGVCVPDPECDAGTDGAADAPLDEFEAGDDVPDSWDEFAPEAEADAGPDAPLDELGAGDAPLDELGAGDADADAPLDELGAGDADADAPLDELGAGDADAGCDPSVWRAFPGTGVPLAIPDDNDTGVLSTVAVSGCPEIAEDILVEVHIVHGFRGDLLVTLIAPDFSETVLHNQAGGSEDNVDGIYSVTLSPSRSLCAGLPRLTAGTWGLRVIDGMPSDTGVLTSWTLSLRGARERCPGGPHPSTDAFPIPIPDDNPIGARSTVSVSGSGALSRVAVFVDIQHEYLGDLTVYLQSPAGTNVILHDRSGSFDDDINTVYPVETPAAESLAALVGSERRGTWTLYAIDTGAAYSGNILRWTLYVE